MSMQIAYVFRLDDGAEHRFEVDIDRRPAEVSADGALPVFAALLNTSVSTVQKWEIGQKRPTGTALKLLHLVQKRGLEVVA